MVGFRSIDWSRLGIEAIVIIVSVLAALALDDWRDARADREVERYLLISLHGDLTADLEELEDALKSGEAVNRRATSCWELRTRMPRNRCPDKQPSGRLICLFIGYSGVDTGLGRAERLWDIPRYRECFWIAGLSKPESGLLFANRV